MARQITETFFGYEQPDVWIEVDGIEYRGEMRAKATDGDPDSNRGCVWWAQCLVRYAPGDNKIEWHPADHVRLDVEPPDGLDFIRSRVRERETISVMTEGHGWDPRTGNCLCGWEPKSTKGAEQEVARHAQQEDSRD